MKTLFAFLFSMPLWATPYPDPSKLVPVKQYGITRLQQGPVATAKWDALPVLRVQVAWSSGERYHVSHLVSEHSGTAALLKRARKRDPWGSYIAELRAGDTTYFDSIGTGKEYRKLTRALSFRFPYVQGKADFKLWAEHPETGVRELVLEETIDGSAAKVLAAQPVETRLLQDSSSSDPLVFTIYADGYRAERKETFFASAQAAVEALMTARFPEVERFRFVAVFAPSQTMIGSAQNYGADPVKRDAFLGLYFPHWNPFGRWYNVVYPTDEAQLRAGLGQVAHDYPLILIDDSAYWGVGNYHMYTAIPGGARQFDFLLLHEFGHYLGLNEEYEESGRTELEFAPGIIEPWSANMTFHPHRGELKWEHLVEASTPLPTPTSTGGNKIGAYRGGYAGSAPRGHNHKPAKSCMMNNGGELCQVCVEGIRTQVRKDAGVESGTL